MKAHQLLLAALTVGVGASFASAAVVFTDDFESPPETLGNEPVNYTVTGDNGSTVTGNVATDGSSQLFAIRDSDGTAGVNIAATRNLGGIAKGEISFDLRLNAGLDHELDVWFKAGARQPIELKFNSNSYNPSNPVIFRSRGNNTYSVITSNFPIGSWETINVKFQDAVGGPPRGTYTVTWNGNTIAYDYLDQGVANYALTTMNIFGAGNQPGSSATPQSIDFDNVQMIVPEPASLALISLAGLAMLRRRRRAA